MDAKKPTPEEPTCPGCAERDRRIAQLEARNAELERRIKQLEQAVEKLQRGSKRQAAPFSKGSPKGQPKKPGRKPGDDYGSQAYRAIPPSIDEEYEAPLPDRCPHCGQRNVAFEKMDEQYQTEVPTRPIHRRFNVAVGRCACCRNRIQGRHALQTSDALGCCGRQLGPNVQALIVHLNKRLGLSHGKIRELLKTGFGVNLTRGGTCGAMLRAARRCRDSYESIVDHVKRSAWAVPDETGWRIGGWNAWLHTAVTASATAYLVAWERGFEASKRLLGEGYAGTMVHDGWGPYECFLGARHQTCLTHLLRRCHELLEVASRGAVIFPRKIKAILQAALEVRDRRDRGEIRATTARQKASVLQAEVETLVGPRKTHPAHERLAAHLFRQRRHLFTFLRREGIDATNWRAEQALRPAVVNRKVWGGNRTEAGAEAQSILMTVWETARRQGLPPMQWLSRTLRSPTSATSLLPASSA